MNVRRIKDGKPFTYDVDYSLAGHKVVGILDDSGQVVPLGVISEVRQTSSGDEQDVWEVTVVQHPEESA